jgi:predicted Ser/Thr protein kinase
MYTVLQTMPKQSKISFTELVVEKEIGIGSYGRVYLGKWNNAPVALKFCRKKANIEDFAKEVRVMVYVFMCVYMFGSMLCNRLLYSLLRN